MSDETTHRPTDRQRPLDHVPMFPPLFLRRHEVPSIPGSSARCLCPFIRSFIMGPKHFCPSVIFHHFFLSPVTYNYFSKRLFSSPFLAANAEGVIVHLRKPLGVFIRWCPFRRFVCLFILFLFFSPEPVRIFYLENHFFP